MTFATIDALRESLAQPSPLESKDPTYVSKMLHELPEIKVVKREAFILDKCKGKRVLEFGASGKLSREIQRSAVEYAGVDLQSFESDRGIIQFDLDEAEEMGLPHGDMTPDVIVCGEVLEHLGNPLHFLKRLHAQYAGIETIISVPNAFAAPAQHWLKKGYENVNADHVAWYSPKTLATLLQRAGYTEADLYVYNGTDYTAEGLIAVVSA